MNGTISRTDGSVIYTGDATLLWRYQTMKSAVKLEAKGLKMTRGRKISPMVKKEFGLKRTASLEQMLEAIDGKIAEIMSTVEVI